jgi:hypothetical protein
LPPVVFSIVTGPMPERIIAALVKASSTLIPSKYM